MRSWIPELKHAPDWSQLTDQRVVDAMLPYFTSKFGNPASRTHGDGQGALYTPRGWETFSFVGSKWHRILKEFRQYLKNAYRVLRTRARQGMVIVVPEGDESDTTRDPAYYDATFDYLCRIGFDII